MASNPLDAVLPEFIARRLVFKFGLVLVVLGLVIGSVGFVATNEVSAETKQQVKSEYRSLAASESTLVEEWVQRNRLTAKLVSKNDAWTGEGGQEMAIELQNKRSTLPNDITNLYVVDIENDGTTLVSTTASSDELSPAASRWLRSQSFEQANEVAVSGPYESNGEQVIAVASLVGSAGGRVFVMEVETRTIAESLQSADRTEGSLVQVVNASNVVTISRSESGDSASETGAVYAQESSVLDPVTAARNLPSDQNAGVIERMPGNSNVIDEPYTAGYAPIEGTDWVVVVHTPRSQLFGFVQTVSNLGALVTLGLILFVGLVGAGLGYSITGSINRLADKAEKMEEGDLGVDLSTTRVDEIGQLYNAFENMRDEVRQRILDEREARNEAEEARTEASQAKSEVRQLAEHLEKKADQYSDVMRACADGDLTQRLDAQSKSEPMSEIGIEFNNMISELEAAIDQVKDFSDEVVERSQLVMEGAESVNDASEQVAESIQEISDEADKQRSRIETFADDLHAIADTVDRIPDEHLDQELRSQLATIERLCDEIDEIAAFSEETMAEAQNVAAAAEEQTSSLTEVTQSASELYDYADPLGEELEAFTTEAEMEFRFGQPSSNPAEED